MQTFWVFQFLKSIQLLGIKSTQKTWSIYEIVKESVLYWQFEIENFIFWCLRMCWALILRIRKYQTSISLFPNKLSRKICVSKLPFSIQMCVADVNTKPWREDCSPCAYIFCLRITYIAHVICKIINDRLSIFIQF